jgi:hypothetical protein
MKSFIVQDPGCVLTLLNNNDYFLNFQNIHVFENPPSLKNNYLEYFLKVLINFISYYFKNLKK